MSTATLYPNPTSPSASTHESAPQHATEKLGIGQLVLMHLLPGMIIAVVSGIIAWFLRPTGLPSLFPLLLAIPIALVPVELGFLFYQGKRQYGRLTLKGVLGYSERLTAREYLIWIPATLVGSMVLFIVFGVADPLVMQTFFAWWPAWLNPDYASLIGQPPLILWTTVVLLMLFGNLIGPAVEELYFRGYLLPRMAHLGRWAIVLNGVLFAIYHFWSPWYVISRAVGVLPFGFVARHKRNVMIPLVVHCAINTIGTILALTVIL